jgi:hypothetical protein
MDMLLLEYTDLTTMHLGKILLIWFFQFICLSNSNPRNVVLVDSFTELFW